ncbi:MAG: hypothetical protein M0T72_10215 [Candidatus Dormibacteraeota bacterium]|nr:hypothetical protein [Candidatus Dormibacteraeota bacterium]
MSPIRMTSDRHDHRRPLRTRHRVAEGLTVTVLAGSIAGLLLAEHSGNLPPTGKFPIY